MSEFWLRLITAAAPGVCLFVVALCFYNCKGKPMIRLHETFATEAEAIEYREAMYRNYHPLGYGTHIQIKRDADINGAVRWVAWGSRAESCD